MIRVEPVGALNDELVEAVTRLVPQLSRSAPAPTVAELEAMVTSEATTLFVARNDSGRIVGMLSLAMFRIPTGVRAWIEDVVVEEAARGSGAGGALVRAAVTLANARGARTVDLTSRPDREVANRMYVREGFEARTTNVYRYSAAPTRAAAPTT